MKIWIALLLALVMCLALCACSNKDADKADNEPVQTEETEGTDVTSGSDLQPTEPLVSSDSNIQPTEPLVSSDSDLQP